MISFHLFVCLDFHFSFVVVYLFLWFRDKILSKVSPADARNMNILRGQANELTVSFFCNFVYLSPTLNLVRHIFCHYYSPTTVDTPLPLLKLISALTKRESNSVVLLLMPLRKLTRKESCLNIMPPFQVSKSRSVK